VEAMTTDRVMTLTTERVVQKSWNCSKVVAGPSSVFARQPSGRKALFDSIHHTSKTGHYDKTPAIPTATSLPRFDGSWRPRTLKPNSKEFRTVQGNVPTFTKSMMGDQVDSRKPSSGAFGFGTMGRRLPGLPGVQGGVHTTDVYISKKHAEINYCKESPGPVYTMKSGFGNQKPSQFRSSSAWRFGTQERFQPGRRGHLPDMTMADPISPGPAAYNY